MTLLHRRSGIVLFDSDLGCFYISTLEFYWKGFLYFSLFLWILLYFGVKAVRGRRRYISVFLLDMYRIGYVCVDYCIVTDELGRH